MAKYEKVESASIQIGIELARRGPFSHNIISAILRQVAQDLGTNKANGLVDKHKLTKKLGIPKVEEK